MADQKNKYKNIETIEGVVRSGLCISCGICAGICPQDCIEMSMKNGEVIAQIDDEKCVKCGKCIRVCPAGEIGVYTGESEDIRDYILGDYSEILFAQSGNRDILTYAQSGGVISTLVEALLGGGVYDRAFLVSNNGNTQPLVTKMFQKGDSIAEETGGSQYLTVSHEGTVRFIREHPDYRVILVAQGCVMSGLKKCIEALGLKEENYLFLGFFCDKTMNYRVIDYFNQGAFGPEGKLVNVRFRYKGKEGWPGNVRLEYSDGTVKEYGKEKRSEVKDYFVPERCLYCLDKLNRNADIAVGDNYIKENADKSGSSSVMIRTGKGKAIWEKYAKLFRCHKDDVKQFAASQVLAHKTQNYAFSIIKGFYPGRKTGLGKRILYREALHKIRVGKKGNVTSISRDRKRAERKRRILDRLNSLRG